MSRGLSSNLKSIIASARFRFSHLVEIQWDSADGGTDYLTDSQIDISYSGNTYVASGFLLGSDSVKETGDVTVGNLTIQLSGANQSYISKILGGAGIIDRKVKIYRYFQPTESGSNEALLMYYGRIIEWELTESSTSSAVLLTAGNHWADFLRVSGRRTNQTSQHRFFPSDNGFEFAGKIDPQSARFGFRNPSEGSAIIGGGRSPIRGR